MVSTLPKVLTFVAETLREIERTPAEGIHGETSLLESGLLDSNSALLLAVWIEEQVGRELDLGELELAEIWDTPALIAAFIERHR